MAATNLEKIVRGDRARIEALILSQEASIRRAFRTFLDNVRSTPARRAVREALERGDMEGALNIIDSHIMALGNVTSRVFTEAGIKETAALTRQLKGSAIAISFDPSYPRAAELMRLNRLSFVQNFTRSQREASRAALVEAQRAGLGAIQTARAFRDSIGLTQFQRQAVINYRQLLEAGDAQALLRDLRDRRFDASVRHLLEDGEPLGAERITRMVDQYRDRYLQYRAETIARTEAHSIVNQARDEALYQAVERVDLPASAVSQTWAATRDKRTRDTHAEMDGQVRALGQPFTSPSGAQMLYPGDHSLGAPASEIVNCRCVVFTTVNV